MRGSSGEGNYSRSFYRVRGQLSLVGLLSVFITNCDSPLIPGEAVWETVAVVPTSTGMAELAIKRSGGVAEPYVLTGTNTGISRIFRYDGWGFVLEYEVADPDHRWLNDIGFWGSSFYDFEGLGVGGKGESRLRPPFAPFILKYEGSAWREVQVKNSPAGAAIAVIPIDRYEAWVILDDISGGGPLASGKLYKLKGQELEPHAEVGTLKKNGIVYSASSGITYVTPIGPEYEFKPVVLISNDRGLSWVKEVITCPTPGYKLQNCFPACVTGEKLFLIGVFSGGGYGIIQRTGSPGVGVYELLFLSNKSPYCLSLNDCAADRDSLLAIGSETSVIFQSGAWAYEKLPHPLVFYELSPAPAGGFWAIADSLNYGRLELLYHP